MMKAAVHAPVIYLDHASTTPVHPEVLDAMVPFFTRCFGNPSSIHALGREASQALEKAHQDVAEDLGCLPDEIIFTGSGSESDNLAIRGAALALRERGDHIITSAVEHHAVLNTCRQLHEKFGFEITVLPVDSAGMISPEHVAAAITGRTVLISIMAANNEVGTIQPVEEIAIIARERGVLFHTDAIQAAGFLDLNLREMPFDLLSLSAHKFYGPKGVGILFVRRGTPLAPQVTGGSQEGKRRAGTENVAGIAGAARALRLALAHREENCTRLAKLRDRLISGILMQVPGALLTGHPSRRMPNSASFVFPSLPGPEELLLMLDLNRIAASSGSACTARALEPSHVLTAMGMPADLASGSLRLTLGSVTNEQDIDWVLKVLPDIILDLQGLAIGYHPAD